MSKKYRKAYNYLNHIEHLLILVSIVTGWVSISSFASLVCVPVVITIPSVETKLCTITGGIKRYKSIIKRKKKKHDETVSLGKTLEVLKALID